MGVARTGQRPRRRAQRPILRQLTGLCGRIGRCHAHRAAKEPAPRTRHPDHGSRASCADGSTWDEMTTTVDVSSGGACFDLTHEAELGQVLLLTLAAAQAAAAARPDGQRATASTRWSEGVRRRGDQRRVGVMFFGKHPPRGFQERPAARYLLPSDSIVNAPAPQGLRAGETPFGGLPAIAAHDGLAEDPPLDTMVGANGGAPPPRRRRTTPASRYTPPPMTAPSTIPKGRAGVPPGAACRATPAPCSSRRARCRPTGAARRAATCSSTSRSSSSTSGASCCRRSSPWPTTSSRGGARVMTTLTFQVGDIVLLQEASGGFATRAEVRGISRAQPTIERLHLRFLDRQAPDRLLRQ